MNDGPQQVPMQLKVELPKGEDVGIFADFANVWHTPNTFVLDFLSVKGPANPVKNPETGQVDHAAIEAVIGARVRIPSEQIFPLIKALQAQGAQWLAETGRSEPPENWLPSVH